MATTHTFLSRRMCAAAPPSRLRRQQVCVTALFNFGKKNSASVPVDSAAKTTSGKRSSGKEAEPSARKEETEFTKALNAFDFSQVRSRKDADLLYDAKYGKRGEDGKMTPEQYAALRRKVGGTAKDFFKDWIEDEAPKNIKPYAKPADGIAGATVPYLPFLIGVVVAVLAATVFVVQQTS